MSGGNLLKGTKKMFQRFRFSDQLHYKLWCNWIGAYPHDKLWNHRVCWWSSQCRKICFRS